MTTLEVPPPARSSAAPGNPAVESAAPRKDADSEAINGVLDKYERSYDTLDVSVAAALWRRPDTRELERAFATLSSQNLTFDRCSLAVADERATANCHGAVTFVPRVGAPTARTRKLTWVIELARADGRWLIERVTASEQR